MGVAKYGGFARVLLPSGRAFQVTIPEGVRDGAQLRVRGLGRLGTDGGEPGDALVSIEVEPTGEPQRGEDVTATVTVRRLTAELGGSAVVKLPTGRKFEGAIPAGVKDGAQIRFRGLGLPGPEGGQPGDAIVTVKIEPGHEAASGQVDAQPSSGPLDPGELP
jgi:DnaJ-class molecular chaperone